MAKQAVDTYHEATAHEGNSKKKLDHLELRKAKNKGYTVEHHFDNSGPGVFMHRPEVHAFGEGPEVLAHVGKHLGIKEAKAAANAEDHDEGEDTEAPGGKGENDELAKAPKNGAPPKKKKGELRGEA
jgi:hypothetical protein